MKIGDEFERPENVRWRVIELLQIDGLRHARAVRVTPTAARSAISKRSASEMLIPLDNYVAPAAK